MSNLSADLPPVDPNAAQPPPIDGPPEPHLNFFQQPMVQNVLPLVTSLALHLGLILIGVLALKTYQTFHTVAQEQIIIPDATMAEGAEIGGVPNPGLGPDPTRTGAQDQIQDQAAQGWANKPSETLEANVMGGAGEQTSTSMIGVGPGTAGSGGTGAGPGSGESGGPMAPFGVPGGGGGLGPPSRFMGSGGNARLICYVCDGSGSMMDKLFHLKDELAKAYSSLRVSQAFNILFFVEDKEVHAFPALMLATAQNKEKAQKFLEEISTGPSSNPIPALRFAFSQKPQLIYFLTDGDFEKSSVTNEDVINEIKKLNASGSVKINTIAFFTPKTPEDERKACQDLLSKIAAANGGNFRTVSTADLVR